MTRAIHETNRARDWTRTVEVMRTLTSLTLPAATRTLLWYSIFWPIWDNISSWWGGADTDRFEWPSPAPGAV